MEYDHRRASSGIRDRGNAAGLPVAPLLVSYSEAALAASGGPPIDHPFRIAISSGLSLNDFVWPARQAVYSGFEYLGVANRHTFAAHAVVVRRQHQQFRSDRPRRCHRDVQLWSDCV